MPETQTSETPDTPEYTAAANVSAPAGDVAAQTASPVEFPENSPRTSAHRLSLDRFADVQVELSVQIGSVSMPIGDLLNLGTGSVVKLDREITAPVSVMAQGMKIAGGEVVVVDDKYAVRITSIDGNSAIDTSASKGG